jgi:hypothetical protein
VDAEGSKSAQAGMRVLSFEDKEREKRRLATERETRLAAAAAQAYAEGN